MTTRARRRARRRAHPHQCREQRHADRHDADDRAREHAVTITGNGFTQLPPDSIGNSYVSYGVVVQNPSDDIAERVSLNVAFYNDAGVVVKADNPDHRGDPARPDRRPTARPSKLPGRPGWRCRPRRYLADRDHDDRCVHRAGVSTTSATTSVCRPTPRWLDVRQGSEVGGRGWRSTTTPVARSSAAIAPTSTSCPPAVKPRSRSPRSHDLPTPAGTDVSTRSSRASRCWARELATAQHGAEPAHWTLFGVGAGQDERCRRTGGTDPPAGGVSPASARAAATPITLTDDRRRRPRLRDRPRRATSTASSCWRTARLGDRAQAVSPATSRPPRPLGHPSRVRRAHHSYRLAPPFFTPDERRALLAAAATVARRGCTRRRARRARRHVDDAARARRAPPPRTSWRRCGRRSASDGR